MCVRAWTGKGLERIVLSTHSGSWDDVRDAKRRGVVVLIVCLLWAVDD